MRPDEMWSALESAAEAAGLNVRVAVARDDVEPAFAASRRAQVAGPRAPRLLGPADVHSGYRTALVLGSAGRTLWERMQAEGAPGDADPLDRLTERSVAPLLELLRRADPAAQSAFPFAHERQLVPFQALTRHLPWARLTPLGILVHPRVGPWFAWRAVLLTALDAPPHLAETRDAPCATCPAPCVTACPAHAVDKVGFRWADCTTYRLAESPCRQTCLAREACPAGTGFRYSRDQLDYHYGASLRMLRMWEDGQDL